MKNLFTLGLFLLLFTGIKAQSSASDYFEVYTKSAHSRGGGGFSLNRDSLLARINNVSDTVSTLATFVMSADNPADIDSIFFTLTNSQSSTVYSGELSYSSLSSNSSFRVSGNTLYLTVGPYSYLKRFSATARLKYTNGTSTSIRSFAKN